MVEKNSGTDALHSLSFEKQSTSERLAQMLLEEIQNGELENGYRLPPQRELAQMFGLGMSSVREALKILNVMGYIKSMHGRGTFVVFPPEGRDDEVDIGQALKLISFSDVMQGRLVIECAVAQRAAEFAKRKNLDELKRYIEAMRNSLDDVEAWYDADLLGFHVAVAKASQNQTLVEVTKIINRRIRDEYTPLMKNALDNVTEENLKTAIRTAEVVYKRIKTMDPKGASFAMRRHLSIVTEHERIKKTTML
ncbi:MAG: GntR family transcriptional regulator [Desulfobacterales bacterium]|jgi:GntR family transcriptional repressor for pyruvate dehydrogenase complex